VPDLQSAGCGFESQPGLLRTKVYSAFHPSGVGNWVSASAGKAKAGMAHSDCADERVGVQVKLWNPFRTRAIPERFCGGVSLRRGAISSVCTFTFIPLSSDQYSSAVQQIPNILSLCLHPSLCPQLSVWVHQSHRHLQDRVAVEFFSSLSLVIEGRMRHKQTSKPANQQGNVIRCNNKWWNVIMMMMMIPHHCRIFLYTGEAEVWRCYSTRCSSVEPPLSN